MASALLCMVSAPGFGQGVRKGASAAPSAHVYVLRGFLNVFSPGLDTLTTEIQERHIPATVSNHTAWGSLAETAIEHYKAGSERSVVVIGHSLGGSAAADFAERLREAGVPVSLMVTIDPVPGPVVPDNVKRAVNYYVSTGMGSAATRSASYRGPLTNVDRKDLNHVSITTAPEIHRQVIGYVLQAVGPGRRQAAPARMQGHGQHNRSGVGGARAVTAIAH
jgi:pimeloyl-ACP methyl ester carboxylesterase